MQSNSLRHHSFRDSGQWWAQSAVAIVIVFGLIICWTPLILGSEGFSSSQNQLPTNVQQAWNSAFMLIFDKATEYDFGTAFLVKKTFSSNAIILEFLTDDHVVKSCKAKGICAHAKLAQDIRLVYDPAGVHLQFLEGLIFKEVEVVRLSKNPDLALLRVTLQAEKRKWVLPKVLKISQSCALESTEPLYTIGFSDTFDRTSPRVPIENQNSILKRWSEGIFTGYTMSDNNNNANTNYWAGTSVDVLGGGSGGPLIDGRGQVVGVMKNSASNEKNQFRYDGNETIGHLDWQSNAIRCEYLAAFVSGSRQ